MNLQERLITDNRMRWLDVGSGGNFADGFHYLDVYPEGFINPQARHRYFRLDLLNASESALSRLGTFDFIRMQHVFEHFTYEDGLTILTKCSRLLKVGGAILITVPNLRIHIDKYLKSGYHARDGAGFKAWAVNRIPEDAPDSFYFSIFTHSMIHESHKWCYDSEGLRFQLARTGLFDNIEELTIDHPLSVVPFTHNRPEEDLCVIAYKLAENDRPATLAHTTNVVPPVREIVHQPPGALRRMLIIPALLGMLRFKSWLRTTARKVRAA